MRILLLMISIFLMTVSTVSAASGEVSGKDASCAHCHPGQIQEFMKSLHYNNISCIDCHGGEANITEVISINAMENITNLSKDNMVNVCSKCHSNASNQYKKSIHWNQFEKGVTIAATCTDCHGNHNILSSNPNSSRNENIPSVCASCHENQSKMQAWYYGIQTDRFDTYKQSFHYKSLLLGGKGVATCPDCHENHDTRSEFDPESTINKSNLARTCEKQGCHYGGQDAIINGNVHEGLSINLYNIDVKSLITYFYILMIIFELIFTLGLITLSISSKYEIKRRD